MLFVTIHSIFNVTLLVYYLFFLRRKDSERNVTQLLALIFFTVSTFLLCLTIVSEIAYIPLIINILLFIAAVVLYKMIEGSYSLYYAQDLILFAVSITCSLGAVWYLYGIRGDIGSAFGLDDEKFFEYMQTILQVQTSFSIIVISILTLIASYMRGTSYGIRHSKILSSFKETPLPFVLVFAIVVVSTIIQSYFLAVYNFFGFTILFIAVINIVLIYVLSTSLSVLHINRISDIIKLKFLNRYNRLILLENRKPSKAIKKNEKKSDYSFETIIEYLKTNIESLDKNTRESNIDLIYFLLLNSIEKSNKDLTESTILNGMIDSLFSLNSFFIRNRNYYDSIYMHKKINEMFNNEKVVESHRRTYNDPHRSLLNFKLHRIQIDNLNFFKSAINHNNNIDLCNAIVDEIKFILVNHAYLSDFLIKLYINIMISIIKLNNHQNNYYLGELITEISSKSFVENDEYSTEVLLTLSQRVLFKDFYIGETNSILRLYEWVKNAMSSHMSVENFYNFVAFQMLYIFIMHCNRIGNNVYSEVIQFIDKEFSPFFHESILDRLLTGRFLNTYIIVTQIIQPHQVFGRNGITNGKLIILYYFYYTMIFGTQRGRARYYELIHINDDGNRYPIVSLEEVEMYLLPFMQIYETNIEGRHFDYTSMYDELLEYCEQ